MKTFTAATITTTISLLTATALSAPVVARDLPQAVISLSNDMSGAYVTANVPLDNQPHSIPYLFAGTKIDIFGDASSFLATSAMLVGGFSLGPNCQIQSTDGGLQAERIDGELNSQFTYLKFGDKTPQAESTPQITELRGAFIQCSN